jgi:hypothetical protein
MTTERSPAGRLGGAAAPAVAAGAYGQFGKPSVSVTAGAGGPGQLK